MPSDLESWLAANDFLAGSSRVPVSGGCISQSWHITAGDGEEIFVKSLDDAPNRFYEAEAEGLAYLERVGCVTVPKVLGYGEHFIAMRYISSGQQKADFWEDLGRQLAHLHSVERQEFGFLNNNYCGSSVQVNDYEEDGYLFFGEKRLMHHADIALRSGLMSEHDYDQIEQISVSLDKWIPSQPASLLHGDLWSGNVYVSATGGPVFIDPAVYFSWAEIDIAMTRLFGGFPDKFYQAYQEIRPLEYGWQERIPLYNLYPLLNHLNLFGEGYLESVRSILKRFV